MGPTTGVMGGLATDASASMLTLPSARHLRMLYDHRKGCKGAGVESTPLTYPERAHLFRTLLQKTGPGRH